MLMSKLYGEMLKLIESQDHEFSEGKEFRLGIANRIFTLADINGIEFTYHYSDYSIIIGKHTTIVKLNVEGMLWAAGYINGNSSVSEFIAIVSDSRERKHYVTLNYPESTTSNYELPEEHYSKWEADDIRHIINAIKGFMLTPGRFVKA